MQSSNSTMLLTSPPRSRRTNLREHNEPASEAFAAQRLACQFLIGACERALVDLRTSLATAATPSEIRSGLAAADLLGDVLLSWREVLTALEARSA